MDRSLARSNIYRMLSLLLRYPEERTRALMSDDRWLQRFEESVNTLDDRYSRSCFEALRDACSEKRLPDLQEMAAEYERLFGERHSVKDDVSYYMREVMDVLPDQMLVSMTSGEGVEKGVDKGETTAPGAPAGYATFHPSKTPADVHKAEFCVHKFEIMSILAEMESKAVSGERIRLEEVQLDFLSRFIVPSVPVFCEEMINNCLLDVYRTLGLFAREYLKFEENYLGLPEETDSS